MPGSQDRGWGGLTCRCFLDARESGGECQVRLGVSQARGAVTVQGKWLQSEKSSPCKGKVEELCYSGGPTSGPHTLFWPLSRPRALLIYQCTCQARCVVPGAGIHRESWAEFLKGWDTCFLPSTPSNHCQTWETGRKALQEGPPERAVMCSGRKRQTGIMHLVHAMPLRGLCSASGLSLEGSTGIIPIFFKICLFV